MLANNIPYIECLGWFIWAICKTLGWHSIAGSGSGIVEKSQYNGYMDVSKNKGNPKWMVYNGKPYQNGWFGGTTIFGNIHIPTPYFLSKIPRVNRSAPAWISGFLAMDLLKITAAGFFWAMTCVSDETHTCKDLVRPEWYIREYLGRA